ncbi:MAG: hypothetical protein JSR66_13025 [Proteobacteria bacterium]|nr:hypothetical protein [Pseudomonadota bacterium]
MTLVAGCHVVTAHGLADDEAAVGSIARVSIVDRRSGAEIVPHYYRGEYWVAGAPGATYSISIRNRLGERLLAVASVDGVNVVSGATASWDQTGYVFSPNQRYEITGWRKSDSEVAAFTFTASPNSYAERTGRPANVGIIGVALFRERQPEPFYEDEKIAPRAPAVPAPAEPAPSPDEAPSNRASNAGQMRQETRSLNSLASAPKLGTGHGEREYSHVDHTDFKRLQSEPNEIIRIRYDSYDNLIAMGVIKRPRFASPALNPFPGSHAQEYVPDPPGTFDR